MILAGRPGMGKTSLATNIAYNAASRYIRDKEEGIEDAKNMGAPVAFVSLEMSAEQLATSILAVQSAISGDALRMGKTSPTTFRNTSRVQNNLKNHPRII